MKVIREGKPRIFRLRTPGYPPWWRCTGKQCVGEGSNPELAYRRWKKQTERDAG